MQGLIAFQVFVSGIPSTQLSNHAVANGIAFINNDQFPVFVGNKSTLLGTYIVPPFTTVFIPMPGGNTDQIWIQPSNIAGQIVSIIGT
jgi:hypothetical protein